MKKKYDILQKQPFPNVLHNWCPSNFLEIHRKAPLLDSLFNKITGLQLLLKRDSSTSFYPVKFSIFCGAPPDLVPHPLPATFLGSKKKKGKQRKKRVSMQRLLNGCHQSQNVTLLVILEHPEFKNFLSVNHSARQYFPVFHGPSTFKSISLALKNVYGKIVAFSLM